MNWLDDATATSEGMKTIFNTIPDFRMRDMEVATRHLAFQFCSDSYRGNMMEFLNDASSKFAKNWPNNKGTIQEAWERYEKAISLTQSIFDKNSFRLWVGGAYQKTKNRAVMDIMTYYFAFPELIEPAYEKRLDIKQAFEDECDKNQEFVTSLQVSTKTMTATRRRFEIWHDILVRLLNADVPKSPLPPEVV